MNYISELDKLVINKKYRYSVSYCYCEVQVIKNHKVINSVTKTANSTDEAIKSVLSKLYLYET